MREALAEALQAFDGALVVVAHDRHLLAATTDTLLLVDRGTRSAVRRRPRRLPRLGASRAHGAASASGALADRSQNPEAQRGPSPPEALRAAPAAGQQARTARAGNRITERAEAHGGRLARVRAAYARRESRRAEGDRRRSRATSPGSSRGWKPSGSKSPKRCRRSTPNGDDYTLVGPVAGSGARFGNCCRAFCDGSRLSAGTAEHAALDDHPRDRAIDLRAVGQVSGGSPAPPIPLL